MFIYSSLFLANIFLIMTSCQLLLSSFVFALLFMFFSLTSGDVLGLLLDLEKGKVVFSLNGRPVERDFAAARTRRFPDSRFVHLP